MNPITEKIASLNWFFRWRTWLAVAGVIVTVIGVSALSLPNFDGIFLPGTQPNVVDPFGSAVPCRSCHRGTNHGTAVTISDDWSGSMMAHSAQDPLFYAAMAIANKDRDSSGSYCIRCHSPGGWLEGRSDPPTGQGLTGSDLEGVQCNVCHRIKDAMIPDTTVNPPVPGYGNGMMVMQITSDPKRGPFADALELHTFLYDSFQVSSNLCGTCHNVSNPFYATDPITQSPHEYGTIERTYSEWSLSSFPAQGEAGTCQSCHMPPGTGYGCTSPGAMQRPNIPKHDLTGGNAFLPDILYDFWGAAVDTALLRLGKTRVVATLQRAADLSATALRSGDTVALSVTITNLTGHKLPTGYPEGRRMWIFVAGMNVAGDTVFESGSYDFSTGDLTADSQLKVYEVRAGLTVETANQYGLTPGPSFHFILNDSICFDNRIPPLGFTNAAFAEHLAAPVGQSYADGQNWDSTNYILPTEVTQITVVLYYQTASKEYITFLRDENVGNPYDWNAWGDSLYNVWSRKGKSMPVVMESVTIPVGPLSVQGTDQSPTTISLLQNYPNPFNPSTSISFTLDRAREIRLDLFDIAGRKVREIAKGRYGAGKNRVEFRATDLPSGVYFYTLTVGGNSTLTRKLVLLK